MGSSQQKISWFGLFFATRRFELARLLVIKSCHGVSVELLSLIVPIEDVIGELLSAAVYRR